MILELDWSLRDCLCLQAEDGDHFETHDADGVTMEIAFCAQGLAQRTGAMVSQETTPHSPHHNVI